MDLWQERPYCTILSESRNRAASGKLQSLSGKSLPREGRRHVEAQTDQLTVPSLSVTCGVSYSVKGVVGVVDIAFVVDTGAAVSLIRKDVWTQLVNRDSTLVLEQWSGKKACRGQWGFIVYMWVWKHTGFVLGYSIYGHLHCN